MKRVTDCGAETAHPFHIHQRPDSEWQVHCSGQLRHNIPSINEGDVIHVKDTSAGGAAMLVRVDRILTADDGTLTYVTSPA